MRCRVSVCRWRGVVVGRWCLVWLFRVVWSGSVFRELASLWVFGFGRLDLGRIGVSFVVVGRRRFGSFG